jgi:hypothetical protein
VALSCVRKRTDRERLGAQSTAQRWDPGLAWPGILRRRVKFQLFGAVTEDQVLFATDGSPPERAATQTCEGWL